MRAAGHLIDGRVTGGEEADRFDRHNPATGETIGSVTTAGRVEVDRAVRAAREAARDWERVTAADRAASVRAAARRVEALSEELAQLVTEEMGRPIAETREGVRAGRRTLDQYAELGPTHRGRALCGGWGDTDFMAPTPRGVVAVITPWNDPVAVACGLLGAALVTGNTVVFKPSERSPFSGAMLGRLIAETVPAGVLNVLSGDARTGALLAAHPDLDLIAHVGSANSGRSIARAAAEHATPVLLENGGTDPLIIDADVDPDWAAGQAAAGCFTNAGQLCVSVERVYAHAAIADAFLSSLVDQATTTRVGPGTDPDTRMGPLVDRVAREMVDRHVTDAVRRGANCLTGGEIPDNPGAYYPPTVLARCDHEMLVMREETFGPVAPVMVVDSFDEGLDLARDSAYGLSATVLTGSMANAQDAWHELPFGTVKVNAVFGGAPGGAAEPRRHSGHGFGYGPELLDEMTATRVVHMERPPVPRPSQSVGFQSV